MSEILRAPDNVEETVAYLKMFVVGTMLTPNEKYQHGIKAELKLAPSVLMPQKGAGAKADEELSILC